MNPCFGIFHLAGELVQAGMLVLLVVGGLALFRRGRGAARPPSGRRNRIPDALTRSMATLNERYARGEIDRDEYLERKAFLE